MMIPKIAFEENSSFYSLKYQKKDEKNWGKYGSKNLG